MLRVELPLYRQLSLLSLINLLLQVLDFLLHRLHDCDDFVFSNPKTQVAAQSDWLYPWWFGRKKVVQVVFFRQEVRDGEGCGGGETGSFQEIYGEILQSCEQMWSRMTSQGLGGGRQRSFPPQKRCVHV